MNIEKCYIGMAMETEGGFFSPTLNIKMASMNETGQQTKFSVQLWTTFTLLHTCESSYNFR